MTTYKRSRCGPLDPARVATDQAPGGCDVDLGDPALGNLEPERGRLIVGERMAGGHRPNRYEQVPGQVDRLWVLDVHGQRLVVDTTYSPDTTHADRDELGHVVESLRFVARRRGADPNGFVPLSEAIARRDGCRLAHAHQARPSISGRAPVWGARRRLADLKAYPLSKCDRRHPEGWPVLRGPGQGSTRPPGRRVPRRRSRRACASGAAGRDLRLASRARPDRPAS